MSLCLEPFPRAVEDREETGAPFHVVIAYDDAAAYHRALRLLVRTFDRFGDQFDLRPLPWSLANLTSPDWHRHACHDASRAEMVVVSTSGDVGLSPELRSWIGTCCAARRSAEALVVGLPGAPGARRDDQRPLFKYLCHAASAAGLKFLTPGDSDEQPFPGPSE